MGQKKQRKKGFYFVTLGLLILIISTLAYFKFSSTASTAPHITTVQLDLSNKELTKTTDLIYLKQNEKNGTPFEIKHILENSGNKDITRINLEGLLLQKKNQNEAQFLSIKTIKFGHQLYTLNDLKNLGIDLNKDGKVSLVEFSRNQFPLGSLVKGSKREFVLNGEYLKGLPPFNSGNEEARVILDLSYKIE